jgi:hypothetical protein
MIEVSVTLAELDRAYSEIEQIRALVEPGGAIKLILGGHTRGVGASGEIDREELLNALAGLHTQAVALIGSLEEVMTRFAGPDVGAGQ